MVNVGPEPPARLRISELARTGGISVQQVRNYVDAGLLPETARTASGYRIFTTDHARALALVRKVAAGHGWRRARTIMNALHRGDVPAALAAIDAGHAELDRERAEIAAVLGTFEAVASSPSPPYREGALIGDVAAAIGVRTPVLRLWERRGLLRPARQRPTGYRVYDETEFRNAHLVALLRRAHYPVAIVRAFLDELRATGSPERARAELARREQSLYQRSLSRLEATAALHIYLHHLQRPISATVNADGGIPAAADALTTRAAPARGPEPATSREPGHTTDTRRRDTPDARPSDTSDPPP